MRWGRQEDAHEFLRYVIDALQRSALFGLSRYVDFYYLFVMKPVNKWHYEAADVLLTNYVYFMVICLLCYEYMFADVHKKVDMLSYC